MIKLNGIPVVPTMFPDKTSQIWKLPEQILKQTNYSHITWQFESEAEFMHLAQLKDLIDDYQHKTTLRIKYLPYARQDKIISNNNTFALSTFAHLLNHLYFDEVIIHDPHSLYALELINNSKAVYPVEEVMKFAYELKADLFCYPDKGAVSKYTGGDDVQKEIYDYPCVYGEKIRDQQTGKILKYKLIGDVENKIILIVDDICDGGMTFQLLANLLYKVGAKEVHLFVSHGLFTKGIQVLKNSRIKRIFTSDGEICE